MVPIIDGGNAFSDFTSAPTGGSFSPIEKTVGDVMRAVKRVFGDESSVQLEDADIVGWINDAQMEVVRTNGVLKAKSTLAATPGQREYAFPSVGIHKIDAVHYRGYRLPNISIAQAQENMIMGNDDSNRIGGGPQGWYEWAGKLVVWPATDTDENLELFYTARPQNVDSTPTTKLGLPDKYYTAIVDYVLARAYEMDEDLQASQNKNTQFDTKVAQMGEEERTAQNMTYSVITLVD